MIGTPTREAADLVRRYLAGRGRHDPFDRPATSTTTTIPMTTPTITPGWAPVTTAAGMVDQRVVTDHPPQRRGWSEDPRPSTFPPPP